jgi:hypothetical protein
MEIALNIVWLLLLLPALWLYRRQQSNRFAPGSRLARFAPLLTLGCVLVLLFPVISASDDLHATQFVTEDPGSQRRVKQLAAHRSIAVSKSGNLLVPAVASLCGQRYDQVCGLVYIAPSSFAAQAAVSELASRAPPLPLLG